MKILLNKTLTFIQVNGGGNIGQHLQVSQKAGIQEVPDWVRDTDTFAMGSKDGSVVEIGVQAPLQFTEAPPTIQQIMSLRGCSATESDAIVKIETIRFNQGEYPYPPKSAEPLVAPAAPAPVDPGPPPTHTVDSLMVAGLSRESAERALAPPPPPAPPATPTPPKSNGRGAKAKPPADTTNTQAASGITTDPPADQTEKTEGAN